MDPRAYSAACLRKQPRGRYSCGVYAVACPYTDHMRCMLQETVSQLYARVPGVQTLKVDSIRFGSIYSLALP